MAKNPFNHEEQAIIRNLDLVVRAENILNGGLGMDLAKKWRQCVGRRGKEIGLREISSDVEEMMWDDNDWTSYWIDFTWQGHSSRDDWMPIMRTMSSAQGLFGGAPSSLEIIIDLTPFSVNMRRRRAELREFVESLSLKPHSVCCGGITLKWDEQEGAEQWDEQQKKWRPQEIFRYDTPWEFHLDIGDWPAAKADVVSRSRTGGKLADACPVLDAALMEYEQCCIRFRQMRQRIFSWKDDG